MEKTSVKSKMKNLNQQRKILNYDVSCFDLSVVILRFAV
jgi:hypothetical protein